MTTHTRPHMILSGAMPAALLLVFVLGVTACDESSGDNDNNNNTSDGCAAGEVLVGEDCLPDGDQDGVPDGEDNCPTTANADQEDADNDGIGDACESTLPDADGDGIPDADDNCPDEANPTQTDHDDDGEGDACELQDGSPSAPFIIPVTDDGADYHDNQDTSLSANRTIDVYPPNNLDESGPEYFYVFSVPARMSVQAFIDSPEPAGVDVDVHLLSGLDPLTLMDRGHYGANGMAEPGTLYYLVLDTFEGDAQAGPYALHVAIEPWYPGTPDEPVPVGDVAYDAPVSLPVVFVDTRSTATAESDAIDSYPPDTNDESGPEVVYAFTIDEPVYFAAELLLPEPTGVDIDLHLLSDISPTPTLIDRDNHKILAELGPGTYYVVADTCGGDAAAGDYVINITLRAQNLDPTTLFASYMVQATTWIYNNYGLLGYDIGSVLTHDIDYGTYGTIPQTGTPEKTMCVAAVMEIILVAMQLYEQDTGDSTVWDFLPMDSYRYLGADDLKAHLWVNYGDIDSGGSGDALRHFGMGMNVPFERLVPGSVVNVNRTTGTGHAVVFLSFIDINGTEYDIYPDPGTGIEIIGFKYFSSQGSSTPGSGGMDYRWAIFEMHGCPTMPGPRDCNIYYDTTQYLLNCGVIYHPSHWLPAYYTILPSVQFQVNADAAGAQPPTAMPWSIPGAVPPSYFDGQTTDD